MSVNPLDIRTVLLAKHAQHVVLIHFPIALFIAAVAFDHLAQWMKKPDVGRGGVLQSTARCGLYRASRRDGVCRMAVGARRAKARRGNNLLYPTEKAAAFVVEKLDITVLPSAIRLHSWVQHSE